MMEEEQKEIDEDYSRMDQFEDDSYYQYEMDHKLFWCYILDKGCPPRINTEWKHNDTGRMTLSNDNLFAYILGDYELNDGYMLQDIFTVVDMKGDVVLKITDENHVAMIMQTMLSDEITEEKFPF